jgi:hypothetical protein
MHARPADRRTGETSTQVILLVFPSTQVTLLMLPSASRIWIACFKPLETTTKFSNNETRQDGDGYMNTSYEIRCYDYKTALPTNNDALGLLVGLIYSHDTLI